MTSYNVRAIIEVDSKGENPEVLFETEPNSETFIDLDMFLKYKKNKRERLAKEVEESKKISKKVLVKQFLKKMIKKKLEKKKVAEMPLEDYEKEVKKSMMSQMKQNTPSWASLPSGPRVKAKGMTDDDLTLMGLVLGTLSEDSERAQQLKKKKEEFSAKRKNFLDNLPHSKEDAKIFTLGELREILDYDTFPNVLRRKGAKNKVKLFISDKHKRLVFQEYSEK